MTAGTGADATDADLLRAHVEGDHDAFGILFARHRDRLWAVALRTMGNPDDAADGLQDGLVAAYRRAGTYRGDAAVTTWLHRVVVNACLDRLRAAKVRAAVPLPDDVDEYGGRGSLALSTGDEPAEHAEAADRRRLVLAALATLPAEQRAALVLVDMEGYPVAEVARMLDAAEGTVKSRCSRGRAKLAALLGVLRDEPDAPPEDTDGGRAGPEDSGHRDRRHGNAPPSAPVTTTDPPRGPPNG